MGTRFFDDENFVLRHREPYQLGMANAGAHRNSSQFFVTTGWNNAHLDGRNVIFGRVVDGFDVVDQIENVFNHRGLPNEPIEIVAAGVVVE